ncbi:hypothetical protein BDK51DRAFT_32666, partial [Blyttiomyces helicus]
MSTAAEQNDLQSTSRPSDARKYLGTVGTYLMCSPLGGLQVQLTLCSVSTTVVTGLNPVEANRDYQCSCAPDAADRSYCGQVVHRHSDVWGPSKQCALGSSYKRSVETTLQDKPPMVPVDEAQVPGAYVIEVAKKTLECDNWIVLARRGSPGNMYN